MEELHIVIEDVIVGVLFHVIKIGDDRVHFLIFIYGGDTLILFHWSQENIDNFLSMLGCLFLASSLKNIYGSQNCLESGYRISMLKFLMGLLVVLWSRSLFNYLGIPV